MNRKFLALALVGSLAFSCSEGEKKPASPEHEAQENIEASAEAEAEIDPLTDFKFHSMIANLPSPLQTFQIIDNVELENKAIQLTDLSIGANLSTASAKAYGYGVYMTDMGFMAYEQQNQQTLEYLQVCRTLATELGAGDVFDQTITQNFEENSSDEAKFVMMMDEAFTQMDQYMVNNERFVNATEIFVGSWVESQIIATKMLAGEAQNESNMAVWNGIYSQKKHASDLMNVLGEIDSQIDQKIYTAVEDLMMFYAGFGDVSSITQEDIAELQEKLETLKATLLA